MVQMLTGHGCFGHYLHHTARREPTPQCHHCADEDDTAEHTLVACPAWVAQRAQLCDIIGPDLTLPVIIRSLARSREAWQAVSTFCESIMTQKEAAERNREADEAADPIRASTPAIIGLGRRTGESVAYPTSPSGRRASDASDRSPGESGRS
ncbi:uncharacterized protein LOC121731199 [Aricia agestis]|uniref:uncharacterized protein LOC121731199 n=1 Tax=Aricia agestis TaxID=91739 RepID=UPI001C205F60|nr:uncharacterized protein LOC121731199 [Aricia agestis]